jgi:ubiquinone/menaquinone biosynthesis C-methylase UbiE
LDPPRGLILDVPCGTGIYSKAFNENGYDVVAADASLPMLERTGQRREDIPRVLCDISRLPFRGGAFDAVMTIRLFQHYPKDDVTRILHELRRAIKPGGRVIFDTFRWTPRRVPLFRWFLDKSEMYVLSHRDVEGMIQTAALRKVQGVSLYLFSPIWQRKLPLWVLWGLNALERITPQRWLLRTFWACTKD